MIELLSNRYTIPSVKQKIMKIMLYCTKIDNCSYNYKHSQSTSITTDISNDFNWNIARLLWIGHLKTNKNENENNSCYFAQENKVDGKKFPKQLITKILSFLFFSNDNNDWRKKKVTYLDQMKYFIDVGIVRSICDVLRRMNDEPFKDSVDYGVSILLELMTCEKLLNSKQRSLQKTCRELIKQCDGLNIVKL